MTALKKVKPISIERFQTEYFYTRCQYNQGEVWQAQAKSPDHSYRQASMTEILRARFNKKGGPESPGGWWIFTEVVVRYGDTSLFSHDIAGWKRSRFSERPRRYPITDRPDWVCEILSSNASNDLFKKRTVLHEHEVPFYWILEPVEKILTVFEWSEKGYNAILDVTEGFEGAIPPFHSVHLKANELFGED
jgi:Uma2 family endonuclease